MSDQHSDDAGCSGLVHVSPLLTEVSGAVQTDHNLQIFFCSNICVTTRSGAEGSGWSLMTDPLRFDHRKQTQEVPLCCQVNSDNLVQLCAAQCATWEWASVCLCACMRACVQWTWLLWKLPVLLSLQPSPAFFYFFFFELRDVRHMRVRVLCHTGDKGVKV